MHPFSRQIVSRVIRIIKQDSFLRVSLAIIEEWNLIICLKLKNVHFVTVRKAQIS